MHQAQYNYLFMTRITMLALALVMRRQNPHCSLQQSLQHNATPGFNTLASIVQQRMQQTTPATGWLSDNLSQSVCYPYYCHCGIAKQDTHALSPTVQLPM
jgi:hypothetical protein